MLTVSADTADTRPEAFTVATLLLRLIQVPEDDVVLRLAVVPVHNTDEGFADSNPALTPAFTVNPKVATPVPQEPVFVYLMVVVPGFTPVTLPELFIVAVVGTVLLHVPPMVVSLSRVEPVPQTFVLPVIGPITGGPFTVMLFVMNVVPQVFVKV